jgi:hypothetical protein
MEELGLRGMLKQRSAFELQRDALRRLRSGPQIPATQQQGNSKAEEESKR